MSPRQLQNELQQALAHHQAGRWEEAGKLYAHLRRARPRHFDLVHLSGTLALQQGKYDEAAVTLGEARQLGPGSPRCALRHGVALAALGRLADGEAAQRAAVGSDAELPEAWFHLGVILWRQNQLEEAAKAYEQALRLRPGYGEAHDRLGSLLTALRGHAAGEPHFRAAVELDPSLATAHCNLGICLLYRGELGAAIDCFARALERDPRMDHAHVARGLALERCYQLTAAVEAYNRALTQNPRNHEARSARLMALQYLGLSRETMLRAHREFGAAVEAGSGRAPAPRFGNRPDSERRLRIGFLSPDLHRHAVAYFLEPLLAHLDRRQFEVYLYHDHATTDAMSQRLRALVDCWRPVAGQSADAVEALVRADAPDILIDLAGHTGFNRLPLYARRLAPVQATYLGYPDTSGLAAMDYRLVDAITDPAGTADAFCTERLVRFAPTAWSYLPPAEAPELGGDRSGPVTFGCFNNFAKVTDSIMTEWARLLAAVPDSRLVLKGTGLVAPVLAADIWRRLAAAGIPAGRVELLERTPTLAAHLAAYSRIDVALDTFPYHGTTTTCEALWMGVPVVTRAGDRHACRVGASLLAAANHPEWVAGDADEYLRIAATIGRERPRTQAARRDLRAAMARGALLDHPGQGARFGAALREMWRSWCARAEIAA